MIMLRYYEDDEPIVNPEEPQWITDKVEELNKCLDGFWNEVEQSKVRLIKLKLNFEDFFSGEPIPDELVSACFQWVEKLALIRFHFEEVCDDMNAFYDFIRAPPIIPIPVNLYGLEHDPESTLMDESDELRFAIDRFIRYYDRVKEVLIYSTYRYANYEEHNLHHFDDQKRKWKVVANHLIMVISLETRRIQNFQTDKLLPLEARIPVVDRETYATIILANSSVWDSHFGDPVEEPKPSRGQITMDRNTHLTRNVSISANHFKHVQNHDQ